MRPVTLTLLALATIPVAAQSNARMTGILHAQTPAILTQG
jgi:hypothetical protein